MPRTHRTVLAALVSAALLTAGCTLPRLGDDEPAPAPGGWRPCPEVPEDLVGVAAAGMTYECTTITVPLDWDRAAQAGQDPDESLELALVRVRSDQQQDRIGSVILNPGGPGISGVDTAVYLSFGPAFGGLPDEVTRRFDVVGFDPRGVRRSSPVKCISDADLDSAFGADPDPVEPDAFAAMVADGERIAAGCAAKYGDTLRHYSTRQTAYDLDAVRQAVGDEELTYLGYSYGTLLGATYAQLFPQRVRAMVLDGAIDPREDSRTASEGQAHGFEQAFDTFAAWCVATPAQCPQGADARGAVRSALDQARSAPARGDDGREATAGWIFWAVVASLYSETRWPVLAAALDQLAGGDPTGVFDLADAYAEREPDGTYSNLFDINTAINCADDDSTRTVAEVRDLQSRWRTAYPLFGAPLAMGLLTCALWPVPADPYPTGAAEGAPPVLVVGTTGDPATPYEQAPRLADLLGTGVLLTFDGEGHTAYPESTCVAAAVNAYLVDLTVPAAGTVCRS